MSLILRKHVFALIDLFLHDARDSITEDRVGFDGKVSPKRNDVIERERVTVVLHGKIYA